MSVSTRHSAVAGDPRAAMPSAQPRQSPSQFAPMTPPSPFRPPPSPPGPNRPPISRRCSPTRQHAPGIAPGVVDGGGRAGAGRGRSVVLARAQDRERGASYVTQTVARGDLTLTVTANGHVAADAIGQHSAASCRHRGQGPCRRQRPHPQGPGAGRTRHRQAARPDRSLTRALAVRRHGCSRPSRR